VVTEGVQAGDMLLSEGVNRVKPGMKIKPVVVPMEAGNGQPAVATDGGDNPAPVPASGGAAQKTPADAPKAGAE